MDVPPDESLPQQSYPRVVVVELRGPLEEVAVVQSWIEAQALYSDATTTGVFGRNVSCHMNVVVGE